MASPKIVMRSEPPRSGRWLRKRRSKASTGGFAQGFAGCGTAAFWHEKT
jgi:hypothetical protein